MMQEHPRIHQVSQRVEQEEQLDNASIKNFETP
jgi:hypothetical protein